MIPQETVGRLVPYRQETTKTYTFEDIVGSSTVLNQAIDVAKRVSDTPFNVLLNGESGTGKELFAQAIHNQYSPEGPFIPINCGSLPSSLIDSELFGYEGGAFTGAERKGRQGKIEMANGGTLFLDEIGEMPLEIQPILLRVLDDKKVMRLGGSRYIPVDFRLIAATNKDLYQMVLEKRFRSDLYYRLSTFKIELPPLRERGKDIILIARHLIEKICRKLQYHQPELSSEVCKILKEYPWPGNIRQLENAMVYAVVMTQDGIIKANNLPNELKYSNSINYENNNRMTIKEAEKIRIQEAIQYTGNNKNQVAKILGLSKTTVYRKIKEYGIEVR